jgi:hypothetical protein
MRGQRPFIPNEVFHRPDGVSEIRLSQGKTALVDTDDYAIVSGYRWCALHGPRANHLWYAIAHSRGNYKKMVLMHQLLLPGNKEIDHEDGDGINNRRRNIRPASHSQNGFNKKASLHSSQYHGVGWNKRDGKWRAYISRDRKSIHLGSFKFEEDAYAARLRAEKVVYPDFERLRA